MAKAEERALLIYDGDCAFCRRWIEHWRELTGERVHYASSQEIAARFPDVPSEKFRRAVQLIDEDGSRHEGAAAVFRLLAKQPGRGWLLRLYEAPAVAPVSEWAYRLVARHRPFFLRLTTLLWGAKIERPRYALTTRIFLQALAVIYLIAFISLLPQVSGLVGEQGLLPTGAHAGVLQLMAFFGAVASLLAFGGILIVPCLIVAWILYLALTVVGQDFTAFQWDALLLEAGFLALFLVPFSRKDASNTREEPSRMIVWLYRLLAFRLVFSSGAVKLLSEDRTWRDLTALSFHFETQPLPTRLAWYAHQLPAWSLKFATLCVLGLELLVPFLFLLPRRARMLGAAILAGFQLLLIATGNFAFFNLLTLALCLFLIDDGSIERFLPRLKARKAAEAPLPARARRKKFIAVVATLLIILELTHLAMLFMRVPSPALALVVLAQPFRIVNDYGLFAVMTTSRPEIILEGSDDGMTWKEYAFKRKPGDVKRAPGLVAPFQPRLDWQLWFAALGGPDQNPWVANLLIRLLQGSKPVLALFASNPFPDAPPKYVRALLYTYRFTTPEERKRDGAWWRRELKAPYLPTMSLGSFPGGTP